VIVSLLGDAGRSTRDGEPLSPGLFRTTLEELKGRATADTVHPDDLPAAIEAWRGAIAGGVPYNVEGRGRRADGVYRWFYTYGFPLRDEEGRIVHWYLNGAGGRGPVE
jgi:PAS domain-containing protein